MKKIFTVVTLDTNFECARTVAWYRKKKYGEKLILNNYGDIFEGCYRYAVIEEIHEGLYPIPGKSWWFEWNLQKDCYEPIEKPKKVRGYGQFSIG